MNLQKLISPIEDYLKEYSNTYRSLLVADIPMIDVLLDYVIKHKGKQIRPILVLLAANLCGEINDRTLFAASIVEILHNASLIHDDVIDKSDERHKIPTINSTWGNKIAVLFGDYFLSQIFLEISKHKEYEFLDTISNAFNIMVKGELLQMENTKNVNISEDTYLEIIRNKTSILISTCLELGALSVNAKPHEIAALKNFGEYIGLCYQIRDDIFDYMEDDSKIGKTKRTDILEKKITLPLIYSFIKADSPNSQEIKRLILNGELNNEQINKVVNFVNDFQGLEYSEKRANQFLEDAISFLNIFPDSPKKDILLNLAKFIIKREY